MVCVKAGLICGIVCAAIALVLKAVTGLEFSDRIGVSTPVVLFAYVLSGLAAGTIVAALLPLARWLLGAMVVGYVAAIPGVFLLGKTLTPPDEWDDIGLGATLTCSVVGAIVGALAWNDEFGRGSRK